MVGASTPPDKRVTQQLFRPARALTLVLNESAAIFSSAGKLPTSREVIMSTQTTFHRLRALGLALIAGLVVCAPVSAYAGGRFGAGAHGFGFHSGFGFNRGFGFRGCCFRGGFGWWGWPGYGLFLATLPWYYTTW